MALVERVRRDDSPQYADQLKQKWVPIASGADTYELVEAVEGKQIQIISFKFAVNVAGSYILQSGADTIFIFPMSTSGGIFRDGSDLDIPLFCGNVGGNIQITTEAVPTAGGVYLQWREK